MCLNGTPTNETKKPKTNGESTQVLEFFENLAENKSLKRIRQEVKQGSEEVEVKRKGILAAPHVRLLVPQDMVPMEVNPCELKVPDNVPVSPVIPPLKANPSLA